MTKITVLRSASAPHYTADSLDLDLDPSELVKAVAEAVAEHHREAISGGRRPSGGPQKPLGDDERKRASSGKRNSARGMGGEGRFPKSIGSKTTRGKTQAAATIAADPFFDEWQEAEAARGVEYLETDGDVEDIVEAVIEADMKKRGLA